MSRALTRFVAISCIFCTYPAFGWWETGHRTVARIAAQHLTPAARMRLAKILNVPDALEAIADALAIGSTWPDEVKKATNTEEWHFIDLALQDEKSDIPKRCKDENCISARIHSFATQLASQKADGQWSELDAVRFLVHFVGDVHQPLHTISDADLGGNCERLDPPVNEAKNVHALWDGGIVNALDMGDRNLALDLNSYIASLGSDEQKELAGGSVEDWVWESHQLAKADVYFKLHIPTEPVQFPSSCHEAPPEITDFKPKVDSLYVDSTKPVVREQLAKAGLRLARMLNEVL